MKLRKECYGKNYKYKISRELLYQLKPIGILVWYLDDGTFTYPCLEFCTDSYNLETQHLFCQYFMDKHGIECYVKKIKNYYDKKVKYAYRIRFNVKNLKKLIILLQKEFKKYRLPKSMYYKIDLDRQFELFQKRSKKYYLKNKEKIIKKNKEWQKTPKGKLSKKKYRQKNKEKYRQYFKKYNQIPEVKLKKKLNQRKEQGNCLNCDTKLGLYGKMFCKECKPLIKYLQKKYMRSIGKKW